MKKSLLTVIEITSSHFKCLQARLPRGPVLTSIQLHALGERPEEVITQALGGPSFKKDNLVLVVPRRHVILRQMSLPSQDEQEIRKMLELKIPQQLPYSRDEVTVNYRILEKVANGYTKILLAVLPEDNLSPTLNLLNRAKIYPSQILVSSLGIVDWFYQLMPKENDPVAVLNLDYDTAELCFCREGRFLFSRHINFGTKDLNEKSVSELLHQLGLTIRVFRNEFSGEQIKKIYLLSDAPNIELLKSGTEEFYQLPVEVLKSPGLMACEKNEVLTPLRENPLVSLSAGLGFIFGNGREAINLLPKAWRDSEQILWLKNTLFQFVLSVAVLLLLGMSALGLGTYRKFLYLRNLQSRIIETQSTARSAERKWQYIQKIQTLVQNRVPAAELIRDLYLLTPSEIYFSKLSLTQDGSLVLEGMAPNNTSIHQFQKRLIASPLFKDVTLLSATHKDHTDSSSTEFKISCQATGGPGS